VPKSFPGLENGNVFGMSLEKATTKSKTRVLPLVQKCISYLSDTFAVPGQTSQLELWIQPNVNLQAIHSLRSLLNTSTNTSRKVLQKFPPETIIGVLKLYLMELPVSLVTDDIYESLKMLYLSKGEDKVSNRLGSVRNLLSTMPQAHFYTLAYLVNYWNGIVVIEESEQKISKFCDMLGPYILRAEVNLETDISVIPPSH
jgi:RhoGAP domain